MEINVKSRVKKAKKALQRGVTLVEVLIVVAIMAVIAGGATILVFPKLKEARIKNAIIGCGTIKKAAELYRATGGGEGCPTLQELVSAKQIDGGQCIDLPPRPADRVEQHEGRQHGAERRADGCQQDDQEQIFRALRNAKHDAKSPANDSPGQHAEESQR